MQIDIKTSAVQPVRQTFSHIARRLGADKPASRYQEATFDLQPEVNFHYRPLWQPQYELYDKARTAIRMNDWYAFKDPRQYYYGAYTITRSRQQETMEKNIEFVTRRALLSGLSDEQKERIASLMVPLRHVEWAANTNNCFVTAYGWGTAITQATMYHCMDRLGLAQYLSRVGLLLDGNLGTSLVAGKAAWLGAPLWQPLRHLVEDLMVVQDWFETFTAQNAVLDGLLYPLVYRHIDARLCAQSSAGLGMLNEFAIGWFDETSRWVDATLKTAAAESPENAALLSCWIEMWRGRTLEALQPLAVEALGNEDAAAALADIDTAFTARITKLGIAIAAAGERTEARHG
ncbi:aromatic/alkene monooxygenase hydroxylase subunit beta [Paraburkholderia sp. CNPSo 3076]|uniref:aromatic/alkene monooxygenase hydroxylase subunit beta n=1 Tax=Paraburkholderia sp. CNPSo 3076 TaxID=2940936 RepID=UPI002250C33D|nr:aromatic/alkene monooxygenase hydroxylase subunit beta [Paraburkholderia sp. CNPSo 3076]MCX5543102.1 aromatic/alkene monooxygenase hydroxylase subunit beta [Paraburkholderia sp. CNPSo 3076]